VRHTTPQSLHLQFSRVIGYPKDKPIGEMWTSNSCYGTFRSRPDSDYQVYHECDTFHGNSGSALVDTSGYVHGVHFGGGALNLGNLLRWSHYDNLKEWAGRTDESDRPYVLPIAYKITVQYDGYPGETTWFIKDVDTGLIVSGIGKKKSRHFSANTKLPKSGHLFVAGHRYQISMEDSGRNGFCCNYGRRGYMMIKAIRGIISILRVFSLFSLAGPS